MRGGAGGHVREGARGAERALMPADRWYGRAASRMLEFRVLGPLEVRRDGVRWRSAGTRQRSVLAVLLLRAGGVVPVAGLIEDLWDGRPPETAGNALQGYVHHLRKLLGGGSSRRGRPDTSSSSTGHDLDLRRFEALTLAGRDALDAGRCRAGLGRPEQALSLWRGPALADVASEPFARADVARLEELRLAALERRIEADLQLGRHADLVGELETLAAQHPLRERLRGHLMLALYRGGRQADALAVYRATRKILVDELGLDPSPWLASLEGAILRQDPALLAPPAPAPAAPPAVTSLPPEPGGTLLVVPSGPRARLLVALAERLATRPPREILLARIVASADDLSGASASLDGFRSTLHERGIRARAAAFTSPAPGEDLVLLGTEQGADLALIEAPDSLLEPGPPRPDFARILGEMPCDVGLLAGAPAPQLTVGEGRPVVVPFGGVDHEWAAVELAAWLAAASGARLKLVGTRADAERGRRDASRLLARAALLVQRVTAVPTEPVLVAPSGASVLEAAAGAGLLVVGLSGRWRDTGSGRRA
jgi:DNA-binding SARP family transcriptional activator